MRQFYVVWKRLDQSLSSQRTGWNASIAQFNVGCCYEAGEGVEQDHTRALSWYALAAEQGHGTAMHSLAQCYEKGSGVAMDSSLAKLWFSRAEQSGYVSDDDND